MQYCHEAKKDAELELTAAKKASAHAQETLVWQHSARMLLMTLRTIGKGHQ